MRQPRLLLLAGILVFACGAVSAQVLIPVTAAGRVLAQPNPALVIVSQGILAEPDVAIGLAAHTACMQAPGASDLVCAATRASAIRTDIEARTQRAMYQLYQQAGASASGVLTAEKLWLVKP